MREILFKAKDNETGIWYKDGDLFSKGRDYKRKYTCKVTNHGILYTQTHLDTDDSIVQGVDGREGYTDWDMDKLYTNVTLCQFTGLTDKNGVKIFEGDEIYNRTPSRKSQTHYGDNIPLGEYHEPLEPEIEIYNHFISFEDGVFGIKYEDDAEPIHPLMYIPVSYEKDHAKELFCGGWTFYGGKWDWEGEDGDLQYLLSEYEKESESELIKWLGVEKTGRNIHDKK